MTEAMSSRSESAGTDWRVFLGLALTISWILLGVVYIALTIGWGSFLSQSIGDVGQFLEGAFAPIAFLWLVLGLFLQQTELAQNNEAIRKQYEALQRTAEHAETQARAISANELHARQDTFIELAKLVGQQLEVISGLLFLSSQGPPGEGAVSDEEMDALWGRAGSGESGVFSRRLIGLRFSLGGVKEASDLFWGTPIRRRHSESFIQSFERLVHSAEDCDPDGMIVDALHGSAHGRIYRVMRELRPEGVAG